MVVEATWHFLAYFDDSSYMTTELLFSVPKYSDGFNAWLALVVVGLTSIEWLRRKYYHLFYLFHFAFLAFYWFAWTVPAPRGSKSRETPARSHGASPAPDGTRCFTLRLLSDTPARLRLSRLQHTEEFAWYGWWAMCFYGFDKLQRVLRGVLSTTKVDHLEVVPGTQILRVSIKKPWWGYPQLGQ